MSKQDSFDDGDLPPPYTESGPSASEPRQSVTTIFSSHLNNLPLRIQSVQAVRNSARDERDTMDPPPRVVEMTMVPEEAVGEGWFFSDEDRSRTVVRVREDRKLVGDQKKPVKKSQPPQNRAFDEWGRWEDDNQESTTDDVLWWSDHDMAVRLAKYISPERVDRQVVKAHVEQAKKASRWGLFKKSEPSTPPTPIVKAQEEEPVTMAVKAEEVTFRRENEMGIWEGKTGWGLVVKVKLRQ
ncbi:hypothetical protein FVER14953_09801 [Fusarium verticillioides]|nr:hypothetical protein FVER14953_09801 [Fusarium verticillioides]